MAPTSTGGSRNTNSPAARAIVSLASLPQIARLANGQQHVRRQQQIKERGFLAAMWPQLVVSLLLLAGWFMLLKWYF